MTRNRSVLILAPLLFIAIWAGAVRWDMRRLERVCGEIQAGDSIGRVRERVAGAKLLRYLVEDGAPGSGARDVPVHLPWTMGEMTCHVEFDGAIVKATHISRP